MTGQAEASKLADRLTLVAAAIATGVAMSGMWQLFTESIPVPIAARLPMFAFAEFALLASAVRARDRVRAGNSPGFDGVAVWAFAGLSAVLASLDAVSLPEVLVRLSAPLVAAWLWDRGLRIERHRLAGTTGVHWRLTPERILIWLGVAEARSQSAEDVVAARLIFTVAQRTRQLQHLEQASIKGRRLLKAKTRLARALDAAVADAGLATEPARQKQLRSTIAAVCGLDSLVTLNDPAPWTVAPAMARHDAPAAEPDAAEAQDDADLRQRLAEMTQPEQVEWVRQELAEGRIKTYGDCEAITGWTRKTTERRMVAARRPPRPLGLAETEPEDDETDREDVLA